MLLSISIAFKSNTQGRWTERVELETGAGLADFVKEEFDAFLPSGVSAGVSSKEATDLLVYYGAADVAVAAARVRKCDLVASLAEAIKLKQGGVPL